MRPVVGRRATGHAEAHSSKAIVVLEIGEMGWHLSPGEALQVAHELADAVETVRERQDGRIHHPTRASAAENETQAPTGREDISPA